MVTWKIVGKAGGHSDNTMGNFIVGFEDLQYQDSDKDFNDLVVELNGIHLSDKRPEDVPEPSLIYLFGAGILFLASTKLSRRKTVKFINN
jgi:hypothetical protein